MNNPKLKVTRKMYGLIYPISPIGKDEGDICNMEGCRGILKYPKVENCSCHIHPPCHNCVENKLTCTDCYREIE